MDPGLLEDFADGPPDDEVDVVVRLSDADVTPEGLRVVARFGEVVTGRIRRGDIPQVHDSEEVESIKRAVVVRPTDAITHPGAVVAPTSWEQGLDDAVELPATTPVGTDGRRPSSDPATGAGVVLAVLDWWFDLPGPWFTVVQDGRRRSKVAAFWDQRSVNGPGRRPPRYGYGRVLSRADINASLEAPDPYAALNYPPWTGADAAQGAHGTHVASIAGGSESLGVCGVAPGTDLVLVHLADRHRPPEGSGLGTSVSLLEALDFVDRIAGPRPCSVNISVGRHAGDHRGRSLVEQALDRFVASRDGRFISQSAGNYYRQRAHAYVELAPGQTRSVAWEVAAADPTANELEAWYAGQDRIEVTLTAPGGAAVTAVPGQSAELTSDGQVQVRVYNRLAEPNTGLNHIQMFMRPIAPDGAWRVTLTGQDVSDGRVHLWVERDSPQHQSRFSHTDADPEVTLGSIACGYKTIASGAYDAHTTGRPLGPFSSCGPTADGRRRPNLLAPGVRVLAARSAPGPGVPPSLVRKSGTSMAAPHVAGAVALIYEAAGAVSAAEVRRLLTTTASAPPDIVDDPYRAGTGCLDLDHLLEAARALRRSASPAPSRSQL
jgi:subtilisin family serine protease